MVYNQNYLFINFRKLVLFNQNDLLINFKKSAENDMYLFGLLSFKLGFYLSDKIMSCKPSITTNKLHIFTNKTFTFL